MNTTARPTQLVRSPKQSFGQQGYIALISVLIIGAVGLTIGTTLLLLGIGTSQTSFTRQQSAQAKALADACAEYGLNELRKSSSYAGNETLVIAPGECDILPVQGTGPWVIQTVGTVGVVQRKVQVNVTQTTPQIELSSWQEVADF